MGFYQKKTQEIDDKDNHGVDVTNMNILDNEYVYNINAGTEKEPLWVYFWEDAYEEYMNNRKFIREMRNPENKETVFKLMSDIEYNEWCEENIKGWCISDEQMQKELDDVSNFLEKSGVEPKVEKRKPNTPPT